MSTRLHAWLDTLPTWLLVFMLICCLASGYVQWKYITLPAIRRFFQRKHKG